MFLEYFSITSMNIRQQVQVMLLTLLVEPQDIWKLSLNFEIIHGVIMENCTEAA